jgi:hypothetical protein
MGLFSGTVYADEPHVSGSTASTKPWEVGAGFIQQTVMGTRKVDNFDDRVTYESNIQTDVPQAVSRGLGNDMDAAGTSADGTWLSKVFKQAFNPVRRGNVAPRSDIDSAIVDNGQYWARYFDGNQDRSFAGLPVSGTSDEQYFRETNDGMGNTVNKDISLLRIPGQQLLSERAMGIPDRLQQTPSTTQIPRPWDIEMGAWPWMGDKSAQRSPVAAQPLNMDHGIRGGIPSPTGAGGPVGMVNDLATKPLTFRTAPEPWDTTGDGYYVDGGN